MRRERTPRDDDEDEPDVSLRDRMTRLDGELVEAREVLERVAPGEPRVQAPATVAEAFAQADTDGNGSCSLSELRKWWRTTGRGAPPRKWVEQARLLVKSWMQVF